MGDSCCAESTMKIVLFISLVLASGMAAPEARFTCQECVREMHSLGYLVMEGRHEIHDYLAEHYCPTVHDHEFCIERMSKFYIMWLEAIVMHYFVDGGVHICQTSGICDVAKQYTCEECIQGMEWVGEYIEDPIMVAEFTVYLEINVCNVVDDHEDCKDLVKHHFAPMHAMAMDKFFVPAEICGQQPVCGGPTRPPMA